MTIALYRLSMRPQLPQYPTPSLIQSGYGIMAASFGLWAGFRAGDGKSKLPTDGCVPRRPAILLVDNDQVTPPAAARWRLALESAVPTTVAFVATSLAAAFASPRVCYSAIIMTVTLLRAARWRLASETLLPITAAVTGSLTAVARIAARSWARSTSLSSIVSDTSITA